jgi:hypothetical protein
VKFFNLGKLTSHLGLHFDTFCKKIPLDNNKSHNYFTVSPNMYILGDFVETFSHFLSPKNGHTVLVHLKDENGQSAKRFQGLKRLDL